MPKLTNRKVFISGKITGEEATYKKKFEIAQRELEALGYLVMNPAVLPLGFEHQEYIDICYAMMDACHMIVLLPCCKDSKGSAMEQAYAKELKMPIYMIEDFQPAEREWTVEEIMAREG